LASVSVTEKKSFINFDPPEVDGDEEVFFGQRPSSSHQGNQVADD
jgi:hypothetical protein